MSIIKLQDFISDPRAAIDRAASGEHLFVINGDRPVVELRPIAQRDGKVRPYGLAEGAFHVPDDFDAPLPDEMLEDFES
jgi:antitoxin (DNA-binding transcriptional repressor) of toxin-antitoxin stability system